MDPCAVASASLPAAMSCGWCPRAARLQQSAGHVRGERWASRRLPGGAGSQVGEFRNCWSVSMGVLAPATPSTAERAAWDEGRASDDTKPDRVHRNASEYRATKLQAFRRASSDRASNRSCFTRPRRLHHAQSVDPTHQKQRQQQRRPWRARSSGTCGHRTPTTPWCSLVSSRGIPPTIDAA